MPSMHTTVAIVGAGLAGLSAATRLHSNGVAVVVLEAQSRPGGRVHSVPLTSDPDAPCVELGATWFHGTVGNAAFDLGVSAGVVSPPTESQSPEDEEDLGVLVLSTAAAHVAPSGHVRKLETSTDLVVAREYAAPLADLASRKCDPIDPDISVLDYIRTHSSWVDMDPLQRAIFRCRDLLECTVNGCEDSTAELSAPRFGDYETLPGESGPPGKGGMTALVNVLLSRLDAATQVLLNARVTEVRWVPDQPDVETRRASLRLANGDKITADCVIWTPSLNVTKAACRDGVFEPALPSDKISALDARGQGAVEKVFVLLERPLCDVVPNCAMPVLWEEGEGEGSRLDFEPSNRVEWQRSVYALNYDDARQAVSFWLSGKAGRELGRLSELASVEEISALLCKLYAQEVIVKSVVRTNWGANRCTLGSYSFPVVGCEEGAVERLAAPLPSTDRPVLCFAGEATHPRFYSTMHGAIESGYREADRCIRFLPRRECN